MSLSCDFTHRELDIPTRTYAETTRKGVIVPQAGNSTGFPLANLAKYANTLFTATIEEGDQVEDANGTNYEVPNITPYWVGDRFEFYVCELIETQSVTLKTLTLGAQDTVTGWYAESYANTTITMNIAVKGSSRVQTVLGYHNKYEYSGLTSAIVHVGDQITDEYGDTYKIIQVTAYPTKRLTAFNYSVCALVKKEYANRPTTSGTWHLDSETLKTDSRWRHKDYLDDYLTAANLKEDNGATNASYITCFNDDELPISQIFLTKAVDLVFSVGKENAVPKQNAFHYPYAFEESVPITVCAIDKAGITATNLNEQAEQEIRRIVSTYPLGSIREITSSKPAEIDLGETKLYTQTVTISYTRVNDDYTPTYPVFDYGIAFIYEGDRVSGGSEGTWTLSAGAGSTCTQTITSDNNLYLNQTVFGADSSTINGTNLALSYTTTYKKVRWRYKTSGAATAKIVLTFSDASTQTVLAESVSGTFTMGTETITTGKTVDHITLYACDGVGTVTYDFVEIYTGSYILPNCTVIEPPVMVNDALIEIPGRVGSVNQVLGSQSMEVTMECDLDMEPAALTWKRPQTTAGKTDVNNQDVLLELHHRGSFYENWTWLDIGNPAMQFKARLIEMHPSYTGESGKVRLKWREYRHGGASGETASERFGLSL
jgi:hypothetical protein